MRRNGVKNKVRVLALLLGILLIFTGCNESEIGSISKKTTKEIVYSSTEYFVKDGQSDYVIVVSETPSAKESLAASELAYFFNMATGISLQIVSDVGSFTDNSYVFSIGRTNLLDNSSINVKSFNLSTEGFVIKTIGNNVILCGGGEFGTLWSVYYFLETTFNYDCLSADEIVIDKNVTEKKQIIFNDVVNPSINERFTSTPHTNVDVTTAHRMRFTNRESESFIQFGSIHDSFKILDPAIYSEEHAKWYSTTGEQLCYSAHGDEAELEDMVQTAFDNIKDSILANPNKNNLMFGQEDVNIWCQCEKCSEYKQKYGTDSAVVIIFMNKLSEKIDAWMQGVDANREIKLYFFAYHKTTEAPAKEVNGVYEPIDEEVVCRKNVGVYYAPINAKYTKSFDDELNLTYREVLKKWSVLTNNITLYLYQTNFRNYLVPYNTYNSMQSIYSFCKEVGCKGIYDQGQMDNQVCTGFVYLREYLASKILWDVDCDVAEYTDKFFKNFYKIAEEPMRAIYDELRGLLVYDENVLNMGGGIYDALLKEEFWPRNTLLRWIDYIEEANKSIEIYKEVNPKLYQTLSNRICVESISIRYIYLTLYCNDDTIDNYNLKLAFKNDCLKCGILRTEEGVEINGLFTEWGV